MPDENIQEAESQIETVIPIAIKDGLVIKAAGDWELDVLGMPFGDPQHRDSDKQYFTPQTFTDLKTNGGEQPVYYYHGFTPDGKEQVMPEKIGTAKFSQTDTLGHWFRVVLDKSSAYARRVWDAAKQGIARASSGSILHLVRIANDGQILSWPFAELSLFDTGSNRQPSNPAAIVLPVAKAQFINPPPEGEIKQKVRNYKMTPEELQIIVDAVLARMKEQSMADEAMQKEKEAAAAAAASAPASIAAEVAKMVKAEMDKVALASNRLPGGAPTVLKYADSAYDHLDAGDQSVLVGVLSASGKRVNPVAVKSLAAKLEGDKTLIGVHARQAMKMAGIKANEVDYSTYGGFGDDWVGIAYSTAIWEAIRVGTFVANKLPSREIPQGMESIYLPLEYTDPVFYNVSEATAITSGSAMPAPTISNSPLGTARALLTLGKLGARVVWTGELEEGSLLPFVSQLRSQLTSAGIEYLESALIDGDSTVSTANINDTAGGGPAASDWFTVFDGFRKSPIVTTTANSRSAAGSLDVTDYINTVKLMGGAGINGLDRSKVSFIVDPNTYYATLALPELLTRDVFASPTIEGGKLIGLWGYGLDVSGSMHKNSAARKANTAGEIDTDTPTNNAYGAILAVRWDQWTLGWRRRMTIETTRFANSDTTEIVAMMRVGLKQRDTESSALTYYVGV